MKELVSVVIPVYNVEKYLVQCLDSVINQSYRNIEVLLVDDGSTDGSGAICDEYVSRDSRIKVFHVANSGVGKARQLGWENSTGEYIMFVDSDDWMPLDAIEVLQKAMTSDLEIVIGGFTRYTEELNRSRYNAVAEGVYNQLEYIKALLLCNVPRFPWGRLYRKNVFVTDSFPNIKRTQDVLMNIHVACRCSKIKVLSHSVYFYRDDSSTSSVKLDYGQSSEYHTQLNNFIFKVLNCSNLYDSTKQDFAMTAFKNYYRALRMGHYDKFDSNIIVEIKKNIDVKRLSFMQKIYLKAFDSAILRKFIVSAYSVKK